MGFAGLLLDDESITGESREYIKIIDDEARRLAEVLRHYVALLMVEQDARERPENRVEMECADMQ
jgi:signal transduction histidine kinase